MIALATPIAAHADSPPQPIPVDGKCAVPVDTSWTKQEQFVWRNICVGKAANFNGEPGYGDYLDPKMPAGLPDSRILRSSFLETILLKDKYRSALTRQGVVIIGARFAEPVDLSNAELQHDLRLYDCLFEQGVDLRSAKTSRTISFTKSNIIDHFNAEDAQIEALYTDHMKISGGVNLLRAHVNKLLALAGSTIDGTINMNGIYVDKSLFMGSTAQFRDIDLTGAHIGENLELDSSTVTGMLNMNGIRVGGDLFMRSKAQFKNVNLLGAHIGETLDLNSSAVAGTLDMNGIHVDHSLFMRVGARFKDIGLIVADIGETLELDGSTVTGKLDMNGIHVGHSLFMRAGARFKDINLTSAHIGGQLNLRNSTVTGKLDMHGVRVDQNLLMQDKAQFNEIDLTAAHIAGQLDLRSSTVTGKFEGRYIDVEQTMFSGNDAVFMDEIDLVSAKLGQDFYLSGGRFNKLVDLGGAQISGVLGLEHSDWQGDATLNLTDAAVGEINLSDDWPDKVDLNGLTYRNLSNLGHFSREKAEIWFGKQPYAPQPYQQLANVLQANGRIVDATAIRYAGKERERATTPRGLYKAGLFLLNYSIGFGYHLEFAFYWAIGFVLLGWVVLYATGQRTKYGMTLGLTYSLDMLLPLVQLRKKHYDIELDPWPRRYFYAHRIIGYVLGLFIVAGISGLTK
jgi:hypothetical protein